MEISNKTIGTLRDKLTPEDFKAFVRAVEPDNDPEGYAYEEWADSPEAMRFVTLLSQKCDDLGMVTSSSVKGVMCATEGEGLLFCACSGPYSKRPTLFGFKKTVSGLASKYPQSYEGAPKECGWILQHTFKEYVAAHFTQLLQKNGVLIRTELMKDDSDGTPVRCYVISEAAKERYGI